MNRYIFTVTAGRSGQSVLQQIIKDNFPEVFPTFEHPQVNTKFKGVIGDLERKFRRNFIETHELLGRGKVINSFRDGNYNFIYKIADKKINEINNLLKKSNKNIYFDISKYFIRGLHIGFVKKLENFSLILLVRDPITNMRSFINRKKNFYLDNDLPSSKSNILVMNETLLSKEELYFWSWCECYLRYLKLINETNFKSCSIIKTENITNPEYLKTQLAKVDFVKPNITINIKGSRNSNLEQGYEATTITMEDIKIFEKFKNKIPKDLLNKIEYLKNYNPHEVHKF